MLGPIQKIKSPNNDTGYLFKARTGSSEYQQFHHQGTNSVTISANNYTNADISTVSNNSQLAIRITR